MSEGNEPAEMPTPRKRAAAAERDEQVIRAFADGAKPLADVSTALSMAGNVVYGSVWRLRRDGLVEKARVGGRTPVWQLTDAGAAKLGVAVPPRAEAPAPVEAPAPAEAPSVPQF